MTILNCTNCGGNHYGSTVCPFIEAPCVICGALTILACADCAINSGGKIARHVCAQPACREQHERGAHAVN